MPAMLITLEPIKAPTKAVAARIRLALDEEQGQWPDVDPPHGPHGDECKMFLEKQDDAEWERRRRNRDPRVVPPSYRILTLYVHDMGTHRRVTMNLHTEEGRPMASMIEDMLRQEQWLDDASTMPTASADQVTAGAVEDPAGIDDKTKDMLEAVRGWPAAKAAGVPRWKHVQKYHTSPGNLTRWRDTLRKKGYDVPDFD